MAKARNFKFGVQNDYKEFYQKNAKLRDIGGVAKVTWPTFKFWDPLDISVTAKAKARNITFGVQKGYKEYYQKCKIKGQRGRGLGHVTCF